MVGLRNWFLAQDGLGKVSVSVIGTLIFVGLLIRMLPLFQGAEAIAFRFISEDGYLLLTVARNIGMGAGMTVSDGTISTNGIQPLIAFVYAAAFWLVGGAKVAGISIVMVLMIIISSVGAWSVYRFSSRVLAVQTDSWVWPALTGALWFVSVLPVAHTMNALETGLYTALVVITLSYFSELMTTGRQYSSREQVTLGVLCGLCFLTRIDAAILVIAIFAVRVFVRVAVHGAVIREVVSEAIPPGLISLVFAAPWLVTNYLRFGSIMPISGPAQSLNAKFAQNLPLLPSKLFEQLLPMLPVPGSLELIPVLSLLFVTVVIVIIGTFVRTQFALQSQTRYAICAYLLFGLGLSSYYGLFYGAPHFLSRYTFPLSPLGLTALISVVLAVSGSLPRFTQPLRVSFILFGALTSAIVSIDRYLVAPRAHQHIQVVRWVEDHVAEQTWVGAVQTGTVGFWHDRTINLDGKVNPLALEARIEEGNVLDYVVRSEIAVLADWVGISSWELLGDDGEPVFDVVIDDSVLNLGVQVRRGTALDGSISKISPQIQ